MNVYSRNQSDRIIINYIQFIQCGPMEPKLQRKNLKDKATNGNKI